VEETLGKKCKWYHVCDIKHAVDFNATNMLKATSEIEHKTLGIPQL